MTSRVFSAPGKLVLCGEYAVVDGKPAVVAAVDRRATASVDLSPDLRVRGNDPRWLVVDDRVLQHDVEGPSLLIAALKEIVARGIELPRVNIAVSTSAFSSAGGKLGLGSSAAAAVAFTAAVLDTTDPALVHEVARAAHRSFQGGGSGIDVAASAYGGVLRFKNGTVAPAPALPASLDLVVVWTGISAQTQGFVDAWKRLTSRTEHIDSIDAATTSFLRACEKDDPQGVIAAIEAARIAMDVMGHAANIDVVTEAHQRIAEIAKAAGGAAKPSGAGGGDIAVCVVPREQRGPLEEALLRASFATVPITIDESGLTVSSSS